MDAIDIYLRDLSIFIRVFATVISISPLSCKA